ncbi:hypothetical protein [Vibrio lentus]|uniref:hypothetical protein n=1 Tax=Vibrio lentus TaxID=136468 RepID=UPI0010BD20B8|nr:hypothetical protein [Vibrio lentus]TKG17737.1 hypothetical protein FCW05_12585 [Vibrio lentus]
MHKFDYPLGAEGIKFLGSRHDDNIAQGILAHFKTQATPEETTARCIKMLQRHWPKKQRVCREACAAMYEAFQVVVDDPTMANAVFHELGDNTPMPTPNYGFKAYEYDKGTIVH